MTRSAMEWATCCSSWSDPRSSRASANATRSRGGAEMLLQNADTAMYKAKARGGDCMIMYNPDMSAGARNRLSMENALFHAIERQQLLLHYQPLISAKTGRLA